MTITQSYLDAMGIQTWQPRTTVPGAKAACVQIAYRLLKNNDCVGYLLVTQDAINRVVWNEVEQLLSAIVAALKLEMQRADAADITATPQGKFILMMGVTAAQMLLAQPSVSLQELRGKLLQDKNYQLPLLITEHPFKLIQDPSEKRQVWQDLQVIVGLLQGG